MARALVIQNEMIVSPGRVLEVLKYLKWKAELVLMEETREIPSLYGYDCLVLLGGTMNVDDTAGFPHLESIRNIMADAFKKGFPVIGLCLGAQMMSRAAGERVRRNCCGETGWSEISLSGEGLKDPVLAGLQNPFEVFQWHDDSFELPRGAVLLGSSGRCPNQIMKIGKNSYGFQCHIEVTEQIITDWVRSYYDEVEEKLGYGAAGRLLKQTAEKMPDYNSACRRILINYFRSIVY